MSRHVLLLISLHCIWFLHRVGSVSFVASPDLIRGDVTGSAAVEWTLESEPGRYDAVGFTFNGADVFRYIPYTGVIPPRVLDGPDGNKQNISVSYDPRFASHNTSTRGIGFRVAGLTPADAGTYTCTYQSLSAPINMDAVLFVYDIPKKPMIEKTTEDYVEGNTTVLLTCTATSTSLPEAYRPAMLYTWSRNGVDIDMTGPPERHAVLSESGQTLEISLVHHTDTTYTCTASENGTQQIFVETEVTLDVLHGPYNLTVNPPKPSARQGASIAITASADCNPACNFTWWGGNQSLIQEAPLRFDKFQPLDANNYTVRAQNMYGMVDLTVEVTLDTSPDFIVIVASAAAGGLVLLIIIIVVAVCCARRRRKKKDVEELVPYATANGPQAFTNGVSNGLNVSVPSHYDIVEGTTAQHPYHVTSGAEDPYTDIASVHDKNKRGQGEGQAPKIPKKVQGITYSEVTFAKDSEARPEVIHSKEPSTQYTKVDFSRKGKSNK